MFVMLRYIYSIVKLYDYRKVHKVFCFNDENYKTQTKFFILNVGYNSILF